MGDVIGDLNSRRGKVEGMTQRGNSQVIRAQVPIVGDVRLCHRSALQDTGPGQVFDAVSLVSGRAQLDAEEIVASRREIPGEQMTGICFQTSTRQGRGVRRYG